MDSTIDLVKKPPFDPPAGCVDPLLWQLARELYEEHNRTTAGDCVTCPRWKRCTGRSLARDGLATALGHHVKESAYWIAYAQIAARPAGRGRS